MNTEKELIEVQVRERRISDWSHQCSRGRANPSRDKNGDVIALFSREYLGNSDRIRHDEKVLNFAEQTRELHGRRSSGQADRTAGLDHVEGGRGNGELLTELTARFRIEARLVRTRRNCLLI